MFSGTSVYRTVLFEPGFWDLLHGMWMGAGLWAADC